MKKLTEIDALISEHVFGEKPIPKGENCFYLPGHGTLWFTGMDGVSESIEGAAWVPRYSSDLYLAFNIVNKMSRKGFKFALWMGGAKGWCCAFTKEEIEKFTSGEDLCSVICNEALRALGVEK